MTDTVALLREALAKAEGKASRLRTQLAAAEQEAVETATAIRVLERLAGAPAATNDAGEAILSHIAVGRENGKAPKEIFDALIATGRDDLNADQVRTQLWRMAKRQVLVSAGGKYWRPPPSLPAPPGDSASPHDFDDFEVDPNERPNTRTPEEAFGIPARKPVFGQHPFDDLDDDTPF